MIRFKVTNVKAEELRKYQIGKFNYEAYSVNHNKLLCGSKTNNFVDTVSCAFKCHYNLALTPDDIWITLAQGFANHINANAEKFRDRFVSFDGKQTLKVERNGFIKGDPNNDWQGVFAEFSDKISNYVGKNRDLIVSDFSTTSPIERAVSEIVLMDTMKEYFTYKVRTMCGIPEIILFGETKDWESIKQRFDVFREFELDWWVDSVDIILDQFIAASKGDINVKFWESIYKWEGGSGSEYVNGWICSLFPYANNINGYSQNKIFTSNGNQIKTIFDTAPKFLSMTDDEFPNGISKVPFIWEYFNEEIRMTFEAGFIGVAYDDENACVRPSLGWAISNNY